MGEHAREEASAASATAARADSGMRELREQLQKLQLEVREASSRPAAGAEAGAFVARIASLGWDTEESVLIERARSVLEAAQVQSADILGLSAAVGRTRLGSVCEAVFASKAALSGAKVVVRGLRREYVQGRAVWLDHRQTPAEPKAVKAVHKVADMIKEMEGGREPPMQVTKDLSTRRVMVSGRRVLFIADGQVRWTRDGVARYAENERGIVAEFAAAS